LNQVEPRQGPNLQKSQKKQDLALVAAVAGHAKLATTAIYVQPNMQDLEAAVDSLMED
jgi:site-specific recombinase XerC